MGKSRKIGPEDLRKKFIIINGFSLHRPNRGNTALNIGTVSFLKEKGLMNDDHEIISFVFYKNPFKKQYWKEEHDNNEIDGKPCKNHIIPVFYLQQRLCVKWGIVLPFTKFGRLIRNVAYEAADYGGDGFSDIYGDRTLQLRYSQTVVVKRLGIPLLILPQTIGPFQKQYNYEYAKRLLEYADSVYVRDNKYVDELAKLKIPYTKTKDLSAFMKPLPWEIEIKPNAIGINVSGLAYSNNYRKLAGEFEVYPRLISEIIEHFRSAGHPIYLIPHAYNYVIPDENNDDMVACREVYEKLENKKDIYLIDKDLLSPQIKYVISKMKFFVGTRMHANFAAIYTNTPVFGLAYSYKFEGAFVNNGLGADQTYMINNLQESDIPEVLNRIDKIYNKYCK